MSLPALTTPVDIKASIMARQPFVIDPSVSFIDWNSIYYDRVEEPDQFKLLADAIKASTSLTRYNSLILHQQAQVSALADALRGHQSIRYLNLERLGPSVDGKPLIEALKSGNIEELNLDMIIHHTSQPAFMQLVSDLVKGSTRLRVLTISMGRIGDEGARLLSEGIKESATLQRLNLDWCDISEVGCDYLCTALRYHSSMTSLSMKSNKIRTSGARSLVDLLCHNTRLTTLEVGCGQGDINGNYLGDEGCKMLAEALKRNTTLTCLTLRRNDITIEGFMELMSAVKNNIGLRVLDVSGNQIGCRDPAHWKYVEECMMYNVTLQTLALENNYLDTDQRDLLNRVRSGKATPLDMDRQKEMDLIIDIAHGRVIPEQKTVDEVLDEFF